MFLDSDCLGIYGSSPNNGFIEKKSVLGFAEIGVICEMILCNCVIFLEIQLEILTIKFLEVTCCKFNGEKRLR